MSNNLLLAYTISKRLNGKKVAVGNTNLGSSFKYKNELLNWINEDYKFNIL